MTTMIQYLSALRIFKPSALILALGVTLVCSLLKKTVLKNAPKKIFVFLPFLIGFVFYAVYCAIATGSFTPLTEDLLLTAEGGFACGCAATLYYVTYEQFFRKRTQVGTPIDRLLEGVVPEEKRSEAAQAIVEDFAQAPQTERFFRVEAILNEYADVSLSQAEIIACAKIVTEVLAQLSAPKA
jgi:hypothetical protein